jgi:hypothetical protein
VRAIHGRRYLNAIVLAKCLRDEPNIQIAFAAFQSGGKVRVDQIVQQARRHAGQKIPNPFIGLIRDVLLARYLKAASKGINRTFSHQVHWNELTTQAHKHNRKLQAKSDGTTTHVSSVPTFHWSHACLWFQHVPRVRSDRQDGTTERYN